MAKAFQSDAVQGGIGSLVFPVLETATTADLIRDRMIACILALAPIDVLTADRFHVHRDDEAQDFDSFIAEHPEASLRRFEVLPFGEEDTPRLTNCDVEERWQQFRVRVAYPATGRAGGTQARARDKMIDRDRDALELAIGLFSRPNFSSPYPDAVCTRWSPTRTRGKPCDVLEIETTMRFYRQLSH